MGLPTNCPTCHKSFRPINGNNDCPYCAVLVETTKRKAHFAALDQLTLEERIRKIEEWIYDYNVPRNWRDVKY